MVRFQPQGHFYYVPVNEIPDDVDYRKKFVARLFVKKTGLPFETVYPAVRRTVLANGSKAYMVQSL